MRYDCYDEIYFAFYSGARGGNRGQWTIPLSANLTDGQFRQKLFILLILYASESTFCLEFLSDFFISCLLHLHLQICDKSSAGPQYVNDTTVEAGVVETVTIKVII